MSWFNKLFIQPIADNFGEVGELKSRFRWVDQQVAKYAKTPLPKVQKIHENVLKQAEEMEEKMGLTGEILEAQSRIEGSQSAARIAGYSSQAKVQQMLRQEGDRRSQALALIRGNKSN